MALVPGTMESTSGVAVTVAVATSVDVVLAKER